MYNINFMYLHCCNHVRDLEQERVCVTSGSHYFYIYYIYDIHHTRAQYYMHTCKHLSRVSDTPADRRFEIFLGKI